MQDVSLDQGGRVTSIDAWFEEHSPLAAVPDDASKQYGPLYRLMALTDSLCVAAALLVAYLLRFGAHKPSPGYLLVLAGVAVLTVPMFHSFGLYAAHKLSSAEEFRRILKAVTLVALAVVVFAFATHTELSRPWVEMSWVLALVATCSSRSAWHGYVRRARDRGELTFRTLIVGTNDEAVELARKLELEPSGFNPIGFVAASSSALALDDPRVLGGISDLRRLVRETGAECLFVASSGVEVDDVERVLKMRRVDGLEVRLSANLPKCLSTRVAIQPVGGVMALAIAGGRLSGAQALAKRSLDIALSAFGILVASPLLLLIAAAVKLTSPGPVLYRQERVGRRGKVFTLLKFRTMVTGADTMLDNLRQLNEADGPLFKLRDDPRVTTVGKWLRKLSLDELPQLLNVLLGTMSLVGPRPPLATEVAAYEGWQMERLEVPPGLTGLWQVSGRSQLTFDEYVRLDLYYVENWSLAYDVFIIAKTVPMMIAARGAY